MLETVHTAEQLHRMGEDGAKRVARWLESTARFTITHTAYDLDPETGAPLDHCRVELLDDSFQTFDLVGSLLDERGRASHRLVVECKNYSSPANQGTLYREYLVICYSAFHRRWQAISGPPSIEFMWATTHPFSVSTWTELTSQSTIRDACSDAEYSHRLGNVNVDDDVAAALSGRLWLSVLNARLTEMIMGRELLIAVKGQMIRLAA